MLTSKSATAARFVAFAALALFVGSPLAIHAGALSPELGFRVFMLGGLLGVVALALGGIGMLRTREGSGKEGRGAALFGLGAGVALTATVLAAALPTSSLPLINDITTSTDRPPEFVAIAALPDHAGADLSYPAEFVEPQRAGYPELGPIAVPASADATLDRIDSLIESFGWERVARDDAAGRIEATHTTRVFRFVDDIAIRVSGFHGGSVVDVRSRSRVGKGDLGANAARIEALRSALTN